MREEDGLKYYPDAQTKKLPYYAQFFNTAEMDSTFYEKFYMYMSKDTFTAMNIATPANFQFFVKALETVTHDNRLDVNKEAMTLLNEFLEKISPLKYANKLGEVPVLSNCHQVSQLKNFRTQKNYLIDFLVDMIVLLNLGIHHGIPKCHGNWETPKFLD